MAWSFHAIDATMLLLLRLRDGGKVLTGCLPHRSEELDGGRGISLTYCTGRAY